MSPQFQFPSVADPLAARVLFGLFAHNGVFALHGDLVNPSKVARLEVENVAVVDPYRALALVSPPETIEGAVYVSLAGCFYRRDRRGALHWCPSREALHALVPEVLRDACLGDT